MNTFNKQAKNWDTEDKIKRSNSIAESIKKNVELDTNSKVLDFGCGTGLLTYPLIDSVKSIRAIDPSKNMLNILEEKNIDNKNIVTECIDIFQLTSKFDLIMSSMVMHHIDDTPKLAKKLYDSLEKNGTLAIADLLFEDGSFHSSQEGVYYNGFLAEDLFETFANVGFLDITIIKTIFTIEKGDRKYPMFLLIAKKL